MTTHTFPIPAASPVEPTWMLDLRQKAWRFFEEMPWPTGNEETWRRTRLTGFRLEDYRPFAGGTGVEPSGGQPAKASTPGDPATLPAEVEKSLSEVESVGELAIVDGAAARYSLDPALAARGVIFTDLDTACRAYPELVQRHFNTAVATDENKFSALHYALWNSGTFVYVPRNVTIDKPLQAVISQSAGKLAGMHHTLVVTEEGAAVTLVEDFVGAAGGMTNSVVELLPGVNSQVHYLHLQNLADTAWNFSTQRMLLTRDSLLRYFIGSWGSRLSKNWINMELNGPGSHGELLGLYVPGGRQHLDHHTNQLHKSPHATSDLLFKGALKDRARSVYQGYVKVYPQAQKTNAYQANRNLMLSKMARADSIPGLEIEADDVRCTHGATAGQIPEEYIFYLMARGIDRGNAERMIVQGFLEEVIDRIPVEGVRSKLETEIARKVGL
ncbi:MAG: Fe-S cluster assembly protein SufD [Chloroflexi bacterium HGW-Chloroflexi-1]|nr:MAG: Fe-S cluster assembly protein SufD [Chloroflexi bacterium HGW-Chloroflexi-1]